MPLARLGTAAVGSAGGGWDVKTRPSRIDKPETASKVQTVERN